MRDEQTFMLLARDTSGYLLLNVNRLQNCFEKRVYIYCLVKRLLIIELPVLSENQQTSKRLHQVYSLSLSGLFALDLSTLYKFHTVCGISNRHRGGKTSEAPPSLRWVGRQ